MVKVVTVGEEEDSRDSHRDRTLGKNSDRACGKIETSKNFIFHRSRVSPDLSMRSKGGCKELLREELCPHFCSKQSLYSFLPDWE